MPMTRQRAQSSFTVEIKRATRRTPEVLTLSKTSSLRRSSLAEQVFSKVSERPHPPQFARGEHPPLIQQTPPPSLTLPVADNPELQAQWSPRRVLPDLLSVPVDLVAERIKQEAEERVTRRKASREERGRMSPATRAARSLSKATAPAAAATEAFAEARAVAQPVQQGLHSPRRKWNMLAVRARRAEREGQPMPRLPAGQRWKRRLPAAYW